MRANDVRISEHFRLIEFECACCGCVRLHPELLKHLEGMRARWGEPLFVTSGFRCERHNREVGGVPKSLHRLGQAADVVVIRADQPRFLSLAKKEGFDEVIAYPGRDFVHLGLKPKA